jgi:hypothetical protein
LEPELVLCFDPVLWWCVELRDLWPLLDLLVVSPKANDAAPKIRALVRRREK